MTNDRVVTLRLSGDIVDRLDEVAKKDDVSRSLVIRRMLLTGLAKREATVAG